MSVTKNRAAVDVIEFVAVDVASLKVRVVVIAAVADSEPSCVAPTVMTWVRSATALFGGGLVSTQLGAPATDEITVPGDRSVPSMLRPRSAAVKFRSPGEAEQTIGDTFCTV